MSLIPHHSSDPVCALCEQKLSLAHSDLVTWFHDLKSRNPNVHVSWSFRDEASQEDSFKNGTTKLHFPDSAHNKQPAEALDIFQIDDAGKAVWNPVFMAKIAHEYPALKWGGSWKTLGDTDHFEISRAPLST
jgi:hypothetical protein